LQKAKTLKEPEIKYPITQEHITESPANSSNIIRSLLYFWLKSVQKYWSIWIINTCIACIALVYPILRWCRGRKSHREHQVVR